LIQLRVLIGAAAVLTLGFRAAGASAEEAVFQPAAPASAANVPAGSLDLTLDARMPDGVTLAVHYGSDALERMQDRAYPEKVFAFARKAYAILTDDLGFDGPGRAGFDRIDLYLVEPSATPRIPGVDPEDFRRAPLFVIRRLEKGRKSPAILLPVDYPRFLALWEKVNRVPFQGRRDAGRDLAGSVMHEMTHAVLHAYHENLGSTEYRIRNGDWYTEGLARFFETKLASDAGFASQGFRRRVQNRLQFSRGGANYFLRFPDQSFFGLRYESALFWLYFEKKFGIAKIVELTRLFKDLPFDATPERYAELLEDVTSIEFGGLLNEYFNWVYREDYKAYPESAHLVSVARTQTVWTAGETRLVSPGGEDIRLPNGIVTDWVAQWGEERTTSLRQRVAGDATREADIEPYAFDVHEIWTGAEAPRKLVIRNHGPSKHLAATLYVYGRDGVRTLRQSLRAGREVRFRGGFPKELVKFGLVLVNLDPHRRAEYDIELK
jgi:hypothetical protein